MDLKDLISVIVPIYGVEEYLNKCIDSIINQTYKNLEIILVDDGSPDKCPDICDAFEKKDERIKVIHKKNGGLSDARNAGLDIAHGDYLVFVDSDDWVETNFIEKLYEEIEDNDVIRCQYFVNREQEEIPIQENIKKDIDMLDELYDMNKDYFDELSIYIEAAKHKQYVLQQDEIPKLREQAKSTGNQMDVQAASDMEQFVDRLDKRIYDLQLSRQIAIQTAPQIRMIQNVNQALAEKIQSSILTSIPLWKNQMSIALTLMRQRNAVSAQKAVTDTTNDLLLKNSELLKQNALATTTENERGVVDIETLKTTQKDIIETIEQTLQIQEHGRTKRKQAESELNELETELQNQLLDMKENK